MRIFDAIHTAGFQLPGQKSKPIRGSYLMCGIAGIASTSQDVDLHSVSTMTDALRHRGPDDHGVFVDKQVALGNRRLSIIELSPLGHQPMFSPDRKLCIVHNGEIYNYRELREEFTQKGYPFQTKSDTEVILAAYRIHGYDSVRYLRGMFAFAIWDETKKILFAARDRLGEKPFYYCLHQGRFAFASEIQSLLKLPWVPRELDPAALDEYFALQYIPAPRTIFRNISKLPPAHFLVLRDSGSEMEVRSYWNPGDFQESQGGEPETLLRAQELIEESVKLRLVSDVEVGILLSGGIDSSLLAAIASQNGSQKIKTFSVGFRDRSLNELPHANLVAKRFNTEHFSVMADEVTPEVFRTVMEHIDEPLGDPASIPTYLIAKFASQHVKVVLSGEGADEIFGGYPYYLWEKRFKGMQSIPLAVRMPLGIVLGSFATSRSPRTLHRLVKVLSSRREASVARWVTVFGAHDRKRFYSPEFFSLVGEEDPLSPVYNIYASGRGKDLLGRGIDVDLHLWLPDDLLMKVDKMTMANSLESRAPYLDHKLVEFMSGLGSTYKVKNGKAKTLLKRIAARYLPREIVERKKHGFEVPAADWMRKNFRDLAEDCFSESALRGSGLFRVSPVMEEWHLLKTQKRYTTPRKLWLMFCFLQWARRYRLSV